MPATPRRHLAVKIALFVVILGLFLEGGLQVWWRLRSGKWLISQEAESAFVPHPYLVASPRPGFSSTRKGVTITHNADGFRGPALQSPREGVRRIVVAGGSATYCVGVTDPDTWPARLQAHLGPTVEVVNAGVPGYSTAEHVVQSALCFSRLEPAVCVFYVGWNDMRSAHVANLKADYSDLHGPSQWINLHLGAYRGAYGNVMLLKGLARMTRSAHWLLYDMETSSPGPGAFTSQIDSAALSIFKRNLRLIGAACKTIGATPVFVPQIMNTGALTSDTSSGWLPYVRDRDVPALNTAYGDALLEVVREAGYTAVDLRGVPLDSADFLDQGHFSAKGCERFAAAMAPSLGDVR